jgi:hypothetical protein
VHPAGHFGTPGKDRREARIADDLEHEFPATGIADQGRAELATSQRANHGQAQAGSRTVYQTHGQRIQVG